ncbi:MAG: enoyl-CoA hydratase/isomerase family protein [Alphaproteobacteria bacterium]|nr:enoyl-CoA hydratase/isomerase family protein [Alphaproteobacteria bacterium]
MAVDEADEVVFEIRGAIGLITLNRPAPLNALTHAMCVRIHAALRAWIADDGVRAIAIRGAGDRAFCAGGDIQALYHAGRAKAPLATEFYRDEYRLDAAIKHCPKPYIALLDGIVMGGGVGVSVHGSHRLATERIVFAMPETGIGFFPDVGGSYFLPRCPGAIGMYLALTGARLGLGDALCAGIATHAIDRRSIDHVVAALAALSGRADPSAVDEIVRAAALPAPAAPLEQHRAVIDHCFAADTVAGILAALEREGTPWAQAAAAAVRAKSPTSSIVAHRQLRAGATLAFDDCLRLEFRLACRFMEAHDFYEGVRAAVLDKDRHPRWRPAALEGVMPGDIERYFADLGAEELRFD